MPADPSSGAGQGVTFRHGCTLTLPHLSRPESAAALPPEEQGPSSGTLATGAHPGPGSRLPPASWGQSTHG